MLDWKFPADIKQLIDLTIQVIELKHSNPLLRYGDLDVVCAHIPYFHRPGHICAPTLSLLLLITWPLL